jgi:hypothetical protein
MSRIDQLFADLRRQKRKALMPFVTAGDPDLAFTADVIRELDRRGATLCEVGIPYSDPIADGPVIQTSYTRALAHQIKVPAILDMLHSVSSQVKLPLVTMVSYAIVHRYGPVCSRCPTGWSGRGDCAGFARRRSGRVVAHLPSRRFQPDSARHSHDATRAGRAHRPREHRLSLLCFRDGYHR